MDYSSEQRSYQRILKIYAWLIAKAYGLEGSDDHVYYRWLLYIYAWLLAKAYGLHQQSQGVSIMANFVVKDNQAPVPVTFVLGEVKDEEGNVITNPDVVIETVSTDETAIVFTKNADDDNGELSFGSPGQASLQYTAKDRASGKILGAGSDGFIVTTGDPDSISGITASFEGLTPVDETQPAEPGVTPNP